MQKDASAAQQTPLHPRPGRFRHHQRGCFHQDALSRLRLTQACTGALLLSAGLSMRLLNSLCALHWRMCRVMAEEAADRDLEAVVVVVVGRARGLRRCLMFPIVD